ncbi:hypothetical protein [Chondromyces apiculatus]|uniref:Uncharacterized protein n=1 Tax=Chondromyces apiculatus DSM 436 TaxID=1192034 RepID=A0A017T7W5_9BACT|nr:hypothetical protein [Chondromyces apiculatus]EYF05032.1 Hypothetical protein CAP_3622 [Chondromyces apiculatus DSM 436]
MATWMNAAQIAVRYVVGEQRLLEYGERGNLAMRKCADGSVLFDADGVSRFFRVRGAEIAGAQGMVLGGRGQNLGVLGVAKLGGGATVMQGLTVPGARDGARDTRRRMLRSRAEEALAQVPLAKAG